MEAAAELFAERGFRGATMRAIAETRRHQPRLGALPLRVEGEALPRGRLRDVPGPRGAPRRARALAPPKPSSRSARAPELAELLRARIETMVESLLEAPGLHGNLMLRELGRSDAGAARDRAPLHRPGAARTSRRSCAASRPSLSQDVAEWCVRSIAGQIFFYRTHRPALLLMMGRRAYPRDFAKQVADHVLAFSLGGIAAPRAAHGGSHAPPDRDRRRRPRRRSRRARGGCAARGASRTTRASSRAKSACCGARSRAACSRSRSREGETVPANAVVARLDAGDIAAKVASKRQELAVTRRGAAAPGGAGRARPSAPGPTTSPRAARRCRAPRRRRTSRRASTGARASSRRRTSRRCSGSTSRARSATRAGARSSARASCSRKSEAEEGNIALAKRQLDVLREQRELAERQLAELEVELAKHEIRAPATATVVQSQLLWPGELAQPGDRDPSPCSTRATRRRAVHPDVPIWTASIDEALDQQGFIVPGLGDAGDRAYGTK